MGFKVRPNRRAQGWEVDLRGRYPDGQKYRERYASPVSGKAASESWAREREQELMEQWKQRKYQPEAAKEVITFAEYEPLWMEGYVVANNQKPSTRIAKTSILKTHLLPRFGAKRLDQITTEEVQSLKAHLVKLKLSPKTVNAVLTVLNTALKTAVEWGRLQRMPCTIKLVKTMRPAVAFLDFGPYDDLVKASGKVSWLHQAMVLLGGDAGLRMGEMLGLEWTDLDFQRRSIHIQRAIYRGHVTTPKGGRDRRVPMTIALAELLEAHRPVGVERVLVPLRWSRSKTEGAINRNTLASWMRSAQTRAGMKATGAPHILRHTFCSHLAMRGATPKAIQELAGHADLATTQRYMHLSPAHKDAAIALLNDRPTGQAADGQAAENRGA